MSADLSALRRFIGERPGASARELSLRFRLSEGLASAMAERLEARGDVERIERPAASASACAAGCASGCAGCSGCFSAAGAGPAYRLTAQGRLAVERAAARERDLCKTS